MRLCSFRGADGLRPGLVQGDSLVALAAASAIEVIAGAAPVPAGDPVPLSSVVLEAPVIPGTALGIGLNYRAHAAETGNEPPDEPVLFAKMRGTVNRPSGPVVHPEWTRRLDYEGELGVVIGRTAHRVSPGDALDHVFGYMVVDDVSARDRQKSEPQWIRAKSGWGFMPMGPWITSADEAGDPQDMRIRTWVNGELRQDTSTKAMIFTVAELVSFASHVFPLEPGDVITTGTPPGVGVGMDPMRFLQPGDIVRIEISRLGAIEHEIVLP
ncbi:MAG: fumarylacetoacetate hydrolase family protein [Actinobacteria bacterium]|nr:fumarylacetoacetate hydrolase family protein [Actinomycetota bacterium]